MHDDDAAKTTKSAARYVCVCGSIKPKWLMDARCSYCEKKKESPCKTKT
jgi:hypothetical protein